MNTRPTPGGEISLIQARQAADDIYTQMCSSVAVWRISRGERQRRMRMSQSIIEKIDDDPHSAHLSPKEWKMVHDWLKPADASHPLLHDTPYEESGSGSEEDYQ